MTKENKEKLTNHLRLELQAKIGPLLDVLYSVVVALVGFYILVPYLPGQAGVLVTAILLLSGLTLRGAAKGMVTRQSIVSLLKALVAILEK